jgi:hypothetical protein
MDQEIINYLLKLKDQGVQLIKLSYNGGGDDGCIDTVIYTKLDSFGEDEDESELDKVALGISDDIENKFKEYCSDSLLQNIEDWYNNEGGYGHIIFKLADNSYTIENNCYRQEVDTFNHEGTLSLEM